MSKKVLAVALTCISNPFVLAAVGIGAIGMMLFNKEEDQNNSSEAVSDGSEPFLEPLNAEVLTVPATVIEPFETAETTVEETVDLTVEEPFEFEKFDDGDTPSQQDEAISEEDLKKEVIRQAMSELGKRSAAARAKKRKNN